MTVPEFKPVAWLRDTLDGGLSTMTDCCTNIVKEVWLKANPKNVERYTAPLYTADQLAEAYEAGKLEQVAQIEMLRDALENAKDALWNYGVTKHAENAEKALASTADIDDLILCHAAPVAEFIMDGSLTGATNLLVHSGEPLYAREMLYRAWEPKP